jgi:Cu+-exporting ATPase
MGHMVGMSLPASIHPTTGPAGFALVQLVLSAPIIWLGRRFYQLGIPALLRGGPNMDSLVAIGTGAAFVYSLWNTGAILAGVRPVELAHDLYYESSAVLIAMVSLGKYFEARSKQRATDAVGKLVQLAPEQATILVDGERKTIPVEEVTSGDRLLIRPGERVPVDGEIVEGESAFDESMLTGEPIPTTKRSGDPVAAGTLNGSGAVTIRATRVGQDTTLSRIIRVVQQAQGSKAPIANLADRVSYYFVPAVILVAVLAFGIWMFGVGSEFSWALRIAVAVLVISCPCAMGLATPTSIMVAAGRGAQLGMLIKSGEALQRASDIETVVFDKTGTLTRGRPELVDIVPFHDMGADELLAVAAAAESMSEHPLAKAVVERAEADGVRMAEARDFQALSGRGVQARVGERAVLIGTWRLMDEQDVTGLDEGYERAAAPLVDAAKTVLHVAVDGRLTGLLAVADPVREESAETVRVLRERGVHVVMITGDAESTARAVAEQVGIDDIRSQVLPEEKADHVKALQIEGRKTAHVGDGVNDAPALAQADLGVAMGSGIDVAVEAGDVVLMRDDVRAVPAALGLGRATLRNIKQNLFWAFAFNTIGIPIAAGVLVPFGGPTLNPMIAGTAMAASSVLVVSNALRLKRFTPPAITS